MSINDRRQRRLASAESFESEFPQDRIILAFAGLNYKCGDEGQPDSTSDWYVFPALPFNAFNAIARLLPGLRLTVIGYRAGSPQTSEAGVFERTLRYHANNQNMDHHLSGELVVCSIELLLDGKNQAGALKADPLDICDVLELAETDIKAKDNLSHLFDLPGHADRSGNFGSLSGPFRFLWKLLLGVCTRKHIPVLDDVAEEVLGVPPLISEHLQRTMPGTKPVAAYSALRETDRMVEKYLGNDQPNKARNRQRYPVLKLIQHCLHMLGWTFAGVLGVPEFLSQWLSKRCRFVAILPLDSPNGPSEGRATCRTRYTVGEWRSWEAYPYLFRPEGDEGCVRLDIKSLIEKASEALQDSPMGWLANKCSETSELVISLMRRRGYVSNFDFGSLPRRHSLRDVLDRLDGRLLVRCLQSVPGGNEVMTKWVEDVLAACRLLTNKLSQGLDKLPDDPIDNYLAILRDVEGIVAAALDAAREQCGVTVSHVYLDLELLRRHFRSEANVGSNAVEYKDSQGDTSTSDPSKGGIASFDCGTRIEDRLLHLLELPDIPISSVVQALKEWEENEGRRFGETIEGLLEDIESELDDRARNLRMKDTAGVMRENLARLIKEIRGA